MSMEPGSLYIRIPSSVKLEPFVENNEKDREEEKEKEVPDPPRFENVRSNSNISPMLSKRKSPLNRPYIYKKSFTDPNIQRRPVYPQEVVQISLRELTPRTSYAQLLISSLFQESPRERARQLVSTVSLRENMTILFDNTLSDIIEHGHEPHLLLKKHLPALHAINKALHPQASEMEAMSKKDERTWIWFSHLQKKWQNITHHAECLVKEEENVGIPLYTKNKNNTLEHPEWESTKNGLSNFLPAIKDLITDTGRKEIFYAAMGGSHRAEATLKALCDTEEQRTLCHLILRQCHRIVETEDNKTLIQDINNRQIFNTISRDLPLDAPVGVSYSKITIRTKKDKTRNNAIIIKPMIGKNGQMESVEQWYARLFQAVYDSGFLKLTEEEKQAGIVLQHVHNLSLFEMPTTADSGARNEKGMAITPKEAQPELKASPDAKPDPSPGTPEVFPFYMKGREKLYMLVPCLPQLQQMTTCAACSMTIASKQLWPNMFDASFGKRPPYETPIKKKPKVVYTMHTQQDMTYQVVGEIRVDGPREAKTYQRKKFDFILQVHEPEKKPKQQYLAEQERLKQERLKRHPDDSNVIDADRYNIRQIDIPLGHAWLQMSVSSWGKEIPMNPSSPWKIHLKVTELMMKKHIAAVHRIHKTIILEHQKKIIDRLEFFMNKNTRLLNGSLLIPGIKDSDRSSSPLSSSRTSSSLKLEEYFEYTRF